MSEKASCTSFWRIVQETKLFINKILDNLPVSHHQRQPQLNHQHQLYQKVSHSSTVSHINIATASHTPFDLSAPVAESYDSIQETIMQYKSLWEVQLALGEIPGMFEGNILQPYQSRNHQPTQQTRQQPYSSQLDQQQYQSSYQHYTFPDLSSTPSTSELNSIEDCPEHSLGYYSDYESDQTENEMNEDCLWSFSPRQNDISRNSNFRHDRKDSGVFVHDDEEGIIQITSKSRVFECKSELSDWCDLDVYDYESEYGNLAQKSRAIGGGFHQMEVGSLMPPPSLLGTVSTLS